jgi:AraC family transcriptional regulator, transcriptional activator FtrA
MQSIFPMNAPLVAVLAYDRLSTFEFGIAYEVFGLTRPEVGPDWYRFCVVAIEDGPMRADGLLEIRAEFGLEKLQEADLIIIPGWRGFSENVPEALCEALRAAVGRGARIATLCSGVVVAAAAGLLEGLPATTHWRYLDRFTEAYPGVRLLRDVLYVDSGSVLTAAGSAAGIDLCLHIVRNDFGPDVANSVARRMVIPPHRDGGQAQFIERPVPKVREGARLGQLIEWMRANLDKALHVPRLASRAGMSVRTFQRRFEETTGLSPGSWLVQERVARAQELLERPGVTALDDIAVAVGFQSLATLRHHFRARLGTTPSLYRERFGQCASRNEVFVADLIRDQVVLKREKSSRMLLGVG